ncbi:MAG TPA: LysM domain-containing protein, partial [Cytophagales bacterium]|nr:LysM domain-containing protein [Cytophagales bacterium]
MRHLLLSLAIFIGTVAYTQVSEPLKHTVGEGESLYSISKKYHTSVAKIIELNPQVDEGIKTGMVLSVPVEAKSEVVKDQQQLTQIPASVEETQ